MKKILFIGFLVGLSLYGFTQKQIKQYEYWFDNNYQAKISTNITPTISPVLNTTIPTSSLPEGLHTFRIRFQDVSGVWSAPENQLFIKLQLGLPIGKNKISTFRYWLDKDFTKQKTIVVDASNPLILSNYTVNIPAPAKATPDNYEFYPNPLSGHKITYHTQFLFYSQFKDITDKWSVVTVDSVLHPYSVNILCDSLSNGVPIVKNYPKVDTIHFFTTKAEVGDSLVFKTSKPLVIDIFDPTGKKINTITKIESTNDNGFHALLDGEYYVLVHGFNSKDSISYTFNYLHFPRYCILRYNRKIVENNGIDTLTFKGNGFTKSTKFSLMSGGNTVAGVNILCNYLTVVKAGFTFVNTPIGQFDIHVNYGDTTIVIEKGLEVVNSQTHTVLFGDVPMPYKGNYPFAGVYEYDNLILDEGTSLLSYGISQLVIKVKGKIQIGKNVAIRVRNGYYSYAPNYSISNITKDNIQVFTTFLGEGYSLYGEIYGKGGNGGTGGSGGIGSLQRLYNLDHTYIELPGYGGGGGGGGGAGFGGGNSGNGGRGGVHTGIGTDPGPGQAGDSGTKGLVDMGGYGGAGGAALYFSNQTAKPTLGGIGGGKTNVGSGGGYCHGCNLGYGGAGGGGNGGMGGLGDVAYVSGNANYCGYGAGGGGGGGYGGGILFIAANEITCDTTSKPMFFALGQKGGKGGYGLVNATYGSDGEKGEDGIVIINTPNQLPEVITSTEAFGSNSSPKIGGHGLVSGAAKVFYNLDKIITTLKRDFSNLNNGLTIYPNPANDKVFLKTAINTNSGQVIICTLTGERMKIVKVFQPNTEVDISDLSKGVYLIRLEYKGGSSVGKLIKQ